MKPMTVARDIKVIMGLGNPGPVYYTTRHSIGYRVIDALAERFGGTWHDRGSLQSALITINEHPVLLVKSNSYMNSSGDVIPFILKRGIKANQLLVIHDELEKPFGSIGLKDGGSHRGHNGVRSIISVCGDAFIRLRVGIGRPKKSEDVPEYVLQHFTQSEDEIHTVVDCALTMIESLYQHCA
jgi:PTH1 family peptidyl-tRNA hydrolase